MAKQNAIAAYLTKQKVRFGIVEHRKVFTAFDLAATLREKLDRVGKTLLVKADHRYVLVAVPAHRRVHFGKLKKFLGATKVAIAQEQEMVKALKVKAGALTPFGSFHKVPVVVDAALAKAKDVLLGTGSFTQSVRMRMQDFLKLEKAEKGDITEAADLPPLPKKPAAKTPKRRPTKQSPARRKPKNSPKR